MDPAGGKKITHFEYLRGEAKLMQRVKDIDCSDWDCSLGENEWLDYEYGQYWPFGGPISLQSLGSSRRRMRGRKPRSQKPAMVPDANQPQMPLPQCRSQQQPPQPAPHQPALRTPLPVHPVPGLEASVQVQVSEVPGGVGAILSHLRFAGASLSHNDFAPGAIGANLNCFGPNCVWVLHYNLHHSTKNITITSY